MGKKMYYVLIIAIAVTSAGIFLIASIINSPELFGLQESGLPPWVYIGVAASVVVVVLAGIADRHKE